MKKNLLLGAAVVLCTAGTAYAANFGYTYSDVYSQYATSPETLRGAQGPIRSEEGASATASHATQYEGDMYDKFRLPPQALRGSLGPIRTAELPSDVAASEMWWSEIKGRAPILGGYAN